MDEKLLRKKVIRLAHENPRLRPHLLPILKEGQEKWIPGDLKENRVRDYLGIPKGETIPMGKLKGAIKKLKDKKDRTPDESSLLKAMNLAVRFKGMSKKKAADIPATVEEIAQDVMNKGGDESLAYAVAWSVYCKYKEPGSPHCQRPPSGYFPGRG